MHACVRACDRFNWPIAVSRAQVGWIRDAIINPLKRQKHPQSLRLELWMRILEGESRRLSRRDARGDSEVCRGRGLDARRRAHECFGFLSPAYFIPGLRNAFRLLEGRRISRPFQADGVASRAALSRHGSLLVARFSASCISLLSYCAARQSGGPTRARGTQTATGRGPLSFSLPPSLPPSCLFLVSSIQKFAKGTRVAENNTTVAAPLITRTAVLLVANT